MTVNITAKKIQVTQAFSDYATKKIEAKLDRFFAGDADCKVTLSEQKNMITCEVTVRTAGLIFRSEQKAADKNDAFDACIDRIIRQIRKNKTRVEKQTYSYENKSHTIESHFFVSSSPDNIGAEINPENLDSDMWSRIDPYIVINDVDRPLFAFWSVPFANNIESGSPLGVSVYSRAIKLLNEADLQWDRYLWEFEGGELAVDAGEEVLRQRPGEDTLGTPSTRDRLFRKFNIDADDNKDKSFYEVFNPTLRDDNYSNGLNEIKRQIEFNCSLAYGTLSNPQNVDKTAEEIKASKQRSYTAVSDMQHSLEAVLEDYIYACNAMADACNLAPSGEYEVSFNWGDGVLEDKDKEQAIQLNEVNSGIRKKTDYLKWRYGVDDKQAAEMLPESGVQSFFDEGGGS
jgi:A118 family predicted phage portal protein